MANINIKASNMELTEALRNYAEDKVRNLSRHNGAVPQNIDIELSRETGHNSGPVFRCEIMFEMPYEKFMLRAESTETDMYAAIDTCVPKIKEQLDKERHRRDTMVKRGGRKLKEMISRWWE